MIIDRQTQSILVRLAIAENTTVSAVLMDAVREYESRRTKFYTVNQAAEKMHLTAATIRYQIRIGKIYADMKKGRYYIPQKEIDPSPTADFSEKPKYKTAKEFAAEKGVSVNTVYYWINTGKIKVEHTGERGHFRIIERGEKP